MGKCVHMWYDYASLKECMIDNGWSLNDIHQFIIHNSTTGVMLVCYIIVLVHIHDHMSRSQDHPA